MPTLTVLSKSRFFRFRELHQKRERVAQGLTLLEGERLVSEALVQGIPMETVLATEDFWGRHPEWIHRVSTAGIQAFILSPKQLETLATTEHPAGVLAVIRRPGWDDRSIRAARSRPDLLGFLILGLQDPGNLGALLRTLAAAGGSGVWLSRHCADPSSPKVLRASAGAALRLPVAEVEDPLVFIKQCAEDRIQTLAAMPKGGRIYTAVDWIRPTIVVLGGEGEGITPAVAKACQQPVHIPMPGGIESLNVAVAGAVLAYEGLRQRRLAVGVKRGETT